MRRGSGVSSGFMRVSQSSRVFIAKSMCSGVVSWNLWRRSVAPLPSSSVTVSSSSAIFCGSKSRSAVRLKAQHSSMSNPNRSAKLASGLTLPCSAHALWVSFQKCSKRPMRSTFSCFSMRAMRSLPVICIPPLTYFLPI